MNILPIVGVAWLGAIGQTQSLTLEEAVRIAEQNAFSVMIAQSSAEKARAQIGEARGAMGIQLGATTNYTRFDRALTANFGGATITTRAIDSIQSVLALTLPIDISGVLANVVRAAQFSAEAAEINIDTERNILRLQVRESFYRVLQAQDAVQIFADSLRLAQERQRVVQVQLDKGVVARVDLLRAQTQTAQSEADLLNAQNNVSLAKQGLNFAMSRPIETPFEVSDSSPGPGEPHVPDELDRIALGSRPELKALNHQARALSSITRSQRRGLAPSVGVSVQYTRDWNAQGFSSSANTAMGVLSLNVPLLDSGITRSRIEQARRDEEQLKFRIDQTALGISLEVRNAYLAYKNAANLLEVAERQIVAAEETYRLARLRTENGEGINLEVVDAQNQLTAARVNGNNAKYGVRIAYAQLQRAVGSDTLGQPTHVGGK